MLSEEAKKTLEEAGFTKMEIGMIDRAESPSGEMQKTDISAGVWQDTIASRKEYTDKMVADDWDKGDIEDAIDSFYEESDTTPWDFLKVEYKPTKPLTDFAYAAAQRALSRIDSHFEGKYKKR